MFSCLFVGPTELRERDWLASCHSLCICSSSFSCSASPIGWNRLSTWRADNGLGSSRLKFLAASSKVEVAPRLAHCLLYSRRGALALQSRARIGRCFSMRAELLALCLCFLLIG